MTVAHVTELVPLSAISLHRITCPPPHVEGIVDLRGEPIAVVDMRSVLGMTSMRTETDSIIEMLEAREADHVRWLDELSACVLEEREFKLATNPHQCAFGKWYDRLMADRDAVENLTNGDLALREVLERFDPIHKRIHGIAQQVTTLAGRGQAAEAQAIIEQTKDTDLATMIELFDKARRLITKLRRGVIVVLESAEGRLGALVDIASEVRVIREEECRTVSTMQSGEGLVQSLVQDDVNDRLIQLLDTQMIHLQCAPNAEPALV